MKIVVIGSKGFIGSHCVEYFCSIGYEVIGCDVLEVKEPNYYYLGEMDN
ncbi:MAG TPA: NAD-dependent epimerase/dehydratase family protein, partial [Bacteroidia bacterium]|nr:NAD-dependent epimerase/dehydratase family protein [Bacteroidia bacterium]